MNTNQELKIIATAMTDMLTATSKLGKELENLTIEKEDVVMLTGACAQVEAIALKILLEGDAFEGEEEHMNMLKLEKAIRASISADMCLRGGDARNAMTVDLGKGLNTMRAEPKTDDTGVDDILDSVVDKLIDKYGDELEDALDGKNEELARQVEKDVFNLLKDKL